MKSTEGRGLEGKGNNWGAREPVRKARMKARRIRTVARGLVECSEGKGG